MDKSAKSVSQEQLKARKPDNKRENVETDEYVKAARERHGIKSLPHEGSNVSGQPHDKRYGNEYERTEHTAQIKGDTTRNPFAKPESQDEFDKDEGKDK